MKNIIRKFKETSVIAGGIFLFIQAALSVLLIKFFENYTFYFLLSLVVLLVLYLIIVYIIIKTDFPGEFVGKMSYNMSILDSKYKIKELCKKAKKSILLSGPNMAYIFGQAERQQSNQMFKEIIGDKIIKDSVAVFIIVMDYDEDWINKLNSQSSPQSEDEYYEEMNRIKNYLENFDDRLKEIYSVDDIEKIEKYLSIYKVDYWLNSICLIDFKQGYLQLVDRKSRGAERIIFYINKSDREFINNIYSKFQYIFRRTPVWRKDKNKKVFGENR